MYADGQFKEIAAKDAEDEINQAVGNTKKMGEIVDMLNQWKRNKNKIFSVFTYWVGLTQICVAAHSRPLEISPCRGVFLQCSYQVVPLY